MKRRRQSAVALVTTLIMLSLITFTAVVFLAVTMREKDAVVVSEDMLDAKTLSTMALMEAQAEVVGQMIATTNPTLFDFKVSETTVPYPLLTAVPAPESDVTNVISQLIYDARAPVYVRTNATNANFPWEHRFYLDENRNGRFEPTGWVAVTNEFGVATGETNYLVGDPHWKAVFQVSTPTNFGGDRRVHSSSNKILGRTAYMILPYGKSLDWNYGHNDAKKLNNPSAIYTDGFRRNQGFGSHELNFAALLTGVNSNLWANANAWTLTLGGPPYYEYFTNNTIANRGLAFIDAHAILAHRYNSNYNNLSSISLLYGNAGSFAFTNDLIDSHFITAPMIGLGLPNVEYDVPTASWAGSVNTNPAAGTLFDVKEFWVPGRSYSMTPNATNDSFQYRLLSIGTNVSTYDRYTYYRMLSQIGTDSSIPSGERVHLNYDNRQPNSPSDFLGWTPTNFFNEVAERLLRTNFNISLTDYSHTNHIQIYPTNRYTSAIHRYLQVTANIFDATTNRSSGGSDYPYFPTVFRPVFTNYNQIVSILRYEEVTNSDPVFYAYITREEAGTNAAYMNQVITNNIWGVPWVVGAKKGFPNFNEFELFSTVELTRRLEILKSSTNTPARSFLRQTNQLYTLGVSNLIGVEMWNPYTNYYPRDLQIVAVMNCFAHLTNQFGVMRSQIFSMSTNAPLAANTWRNSTNNAAGFFLPFVTNSVLLPPSIYRASSGQFLATTNLLGTNVVYERGQQFYIPQWGLSMSNRMYAAIIDTTVSPPRVVDYVNFDSFTFGVEDVSQSLANSVDNAPPGATGPANLGNIIRQLFNTNRIGGTSLNNPTHGAVSQIRASLNQNLTDGQPAPRLTDWANYGQQNAAMMDRTLAMATFQRFMGEPLVGVSPYQAVNPAGQNYVKMPTSTNMQAPFTAVAKLLFTNKWEANDPLVHYTLEDLSSLNNGTPVPLLIRPAQTSNAVQNLINLARVNQRYQPWGVLGGNGGFSSVIGYGDASNSNNPAVPPVTSTSADYRFSYFVKDPQVRKPDDWDFPGQKFANVGWLGRVHRGTPWQTVYMKAGAVDDSAPLFLWRRWANSAFTHPTNDWGLPDMFTVATDVNAVKGLLSVNQTNYGAWAAVLGDVLVLSNTTVFGDYSTNTSSTNVVGSAPINYTNLLLDPTSDQFRRIVDGINAVRSVRPANVSGMTITNAFMRMGDILSVPQLSIGNSTTESSPYLSLISPSGVEENLYYGLHDAAIERIPQQILSLLKVDDMPRVVIYAWGQSLKPAPNSVVLSGPYRGMVTNYSVVSEHVTRTVLRIEGGPRSPRAVVENFTVLPSE